MPKLFRSDSPILSFLANLFDFALLNLAALLCALPVLTAGASFTALSGVMSAFVVNGEPVTLRGFFQRFKLVFWRASLCWVVLLALAAVFTFDLQIVSAMDSTLRLISLSFLMFFLLCALLCAVFLFAMLPFGAETPLPRLVKTAFVTAVAKLPRALLMIAVCAFPVVLFLVLPQLFILLAPLWVILWFSLAAFFCAKLGARWCGIPKDAL
ncbi:MAG: DUF624 domain-containing protein [Clostridiaceae bacterium]